jgi:pilus assembly protein TadC
MSSIASRIASRHTNLKRKLYIAGIDVTPEKYVQMRMVSALWLALGFGILVFLFLHRQGGGYFGAIAAFAIVYLVMFNVLMKHVDSSIAKRAKLIDKDVLFAGRFLLVKLNSGQPLINALEDASKSYGISNEYFKEIVRDIDLGTPLEQALDKATLNCPSDKLKKILFQITNALKIGTDVTNFLDAILDEIADEQLIEIQRYGKKLSSLTMFYMLFAVVIPSLGMTILIVIVSLVNINLGGGEFIVILVLLACMQLIFVTLFKAIRPNVHI